MCLWFDENQQFISIRLCWTFTVLNWSNLSISINIFEFDIIFACWFDSDFIPIKSKKSKSRQPDLIFWIFMKIKACIQNWFRILFEGIPVVGKLSWKVLSWNVRHEIGKHEVGKPRSKWESDWWSWKVKLTWKESTKLEIYY